MTMQSENKGRSVVNDLPLQLLLVAIVAVVVVVLSALYVW